MKFKPKDCTITIKLTGRDGTVGYLTLEEDNPVVKPLVEYTTYVLSTLDGWVGEECLEHLRALGISNLDDFYAAEPNDLVTGLTKEDLVELVEAGLVELRLRRLIPKEGDQKVTNIKCVKKGA